MCRAVQPGFPMIISNGVLCISGRWVENRSRIPASRCEECAVLQTVRDWLVWLCRFVYRVVESEVIVAKSGRFCLEDGNTNKFIQCRNKLHCNSFHRLAVSHGSFFLSSRRRGTNFPFTAGTSIP
jgi:hypothetical protein